MAYFFLAVAIVAEVFATSCLKLTSEPNPKWWTYVAVVLGYTVAFSALSLALGRGLPLGVAYAIWAGVGVVLVALISWFFFSDPLSRWQMAGTALVILGVVMLELGGKH